MSVAAPLNQDQLTLPTPWGCPQIIKPVARWLGRQPQYRLSFIIGDTQGCNERAWDIALFFARWWLAIWSNHSTEPVVPLGSCWTR
jgi:hypothetical protein